MFAAILLVCLATLNPLDFFFSGPFSTKVVADKRQKKPQQEQPKKKTPTQEEKQTLATNFFFIFYHQTLQQIRWEVKERKGKPTEALFHNGCRKLWIGRLSRAATAHWRSGGHHRLRRRRRRELQGEQRRGPSGPWRPKLSQAAVCAAAAGGGTCGTGSGCCATPACLHRWRYYSSTTTHCRIARASLIVVVVLLLLSFPSPSSGPCASSRTALQRQHPCKHARTHARRRSSNTRIARIPSQPASNFAKKRN